MLSHRRRVVSVLAASRSGLELLPLSSPRQATATTTPAASTHNILEDATSKVGPQAATLTHQNGAVMFGRCSQANRPLWRPSRHEQAAPPAGSSLSNEPTHTFCSRTDVADQQGNIYSLPKNPTSGH
jgi:hypothetical protein